MPTTNKLFGLADPQYDALRVLSTQTLIGGPGTGGGNVGGGLENKIYLWPADGSTISTYDATQAGLIAALAASISGDTVWLPSIPIALTTAIAIPTNVTLRGISDNAVLSFSGFSGAAIILGQNSTALEFTVNFIATGTEAIGLDATESGARIIHVDATVGGGSSSNIRYRLGSATSPSAATIRYSFPYHKSADDKVYIREAISGSETEISSAISQGMDIATVRGAWAGNAVYCVDCVGTLRVSSDGLTYSTLATWAENGGTPDDGAWVMNAKVDGSGNLIWLRKHCDLSSQVVRLYEAGTGSNLSDLTGDLWTVLGMPSDGETFGNLLIVYGPALTSTMQEIWTITKEVPLILWAEYDASYSSFVVPSIAWNTIAPPTGYAFSNSSESFANALQTDHLGHYLYVSGQDSGNSNRATLWQLNNLAAIRANPATAPSWSVIAYSGQVVSAGTLGEATLTASFYIRCFGDSLYFRAKNASGSTPILGIYNGTTWAWSDPGVGDNANYQAVNYGVWADVSLVAAPSYIRNWAGTQIGSSFTSTFGTDHFSEIWRRLDAVIGQYPLLADVRSGEATGTAAYDVEVVSDATIYYSAIPALHVLDGATAHVEGNYYNTLTLDGSGAVESLAGDRSAWNTTDYAVRHARDISDGTFTYHSNPGMPPMSSYLGSGSFFVGNAGNVATGVSMSGDVSLDNAGVVTILAKAVTAAKMALTNGSIFIGGSDGAAHEQSIHGDGSIDNTGYLTVTGGTGSGVARSGATTDGHLAVWNGSSADSIKDGGAVPTGGGADVFGYGTLTDPPAAGSWTALNHGSAFVGQTANGKLHVRHIGAGGDNLRGYYRAKTGTPKITLAFYTAHTEGDPGYQQVGIFAWDAAGSKGRSFLFNNLNVFVASNWNGAGTWAGESVIETLSYDGFQAPLIWMQYEEDTTNRIIRISNSGIYWYDIFSEAKTTYITADSYGFGIYVTGTRSALATLVHWVEA